MPKKLGLAEPTQIVIDLSEDPEFAKFLSVQKKSTRFTYTSYLRRLKEFTTESGSEMLHNRKEWLTKIFTFGQWLQEKGYSGTYIQSSQGCVRGFFNSARKPLDFTTSERKKLREKSRSTEDFYMNLDHLKTMAQFCGTLKEKWVLICGKSLGFRSCDFVKINYGQLRSVEDQLDKSLCFLGEIKAQKEGTKYFAFLDSDACEVVKQILNANREKPDNESILMTKSKKLHNTYQTMNKSELSEILRSIAKRSGIQTGNRRIRFHLLRKFLADNLSRYMSESKWKQIVAKQIDESAYVGAESLKEDFERAMPTQLISGNGNETKKKVSELEEENKKLKAQLAQSEEVRMKAESAEAISRTQAEDAIRKLNERLTTFETQPRQKRKKVRP